jgi:hypothetical protein
MAAVSRDLVQADAVGDPVKIVCKQAGKEDWVFKKVAPEGGGDAVWYMTKPKKFKAVPWDVDRFHRQLTGLKYEISYAPGEAGAVTAPEAGLDPAQAEVTLTDADGKSVSVEIGKPASEQKTFVRLAGSDRVCVGNANLRTLFKQNAPEYRDREVFRFNADTATRLEVVAQSADAVPISYVFTNDGARWMIESPVTARATAKVSDAVKALSSLNAIAWVADAPDRLPVYGLDPPALTVRVTVEEEVETETPSGAEDDADDDETTEEAPPEPEKVVHTYVVHVSDLAPIGEDTKRYIRVGDESEVGTVMKTTADKFHPVPDEWRDMQVISAAVSGATRIGLTVRGGKTTLVRQDGAWQVEADGAPAEATAVTELLNAMQDLEAVAFVEPGADELAAMGFDAPQADVRVTIPGVEGVERITVGGFTDMTTKRLVYVQYNEAASIAKVRAPDVEKLLRAPLTYLSRAILAIPRDDITRLAMTTSEPCTGQELSIAMEPGGDAWTMVEPIGADVRADRVDALLSALADLRAGSIVADSEELSAFGLHAPAARLIVTTKAGETRELLVTEHDGQCYAKLAGRSLIYGVAKDLLDQLRADFRDGRLVRFDPADLQRFSIRHGNASHTFERRDGSWVYQAEADLPLDSAKLDALVTGLSQIAAERFIRYAHAEGGPFGLDAPAFEARFTRSDGTEHVLTVSAARCQQSANLGHYARTTDCTGVAIISESAAMVLDISLDTLE